jgi:hypothetical protein
LVQVVLVPQKIKNQKTCGFVDNFKLKKTLNLKPALLAMDKPMDNLMDNLAYGCVCPQSCPQVLPTARAFDHKPHRFKFTTSFTFTIKILNSYEW